MDVLEELLPTYGEHGFITSCNKIGENAPPSYWGENQPEAIQGPGYVFPLSYKWKQAIILP